MPAAVEPLAKGRGQSLHEAAALEAAPAPALRQRHADRQPKRVAPSEAGAAGARPFRDEDHSIWHRPSTIPAHPRRPGAARPAVRRPPRLARGGLREPWSLQRSQGPEVSRPRHSRRTLRLGYPQPSWLSPVRTSPPTAPACALEHYRPEGPADLAVDGRRLRGGTLADNLPYTVLEAMGCGRSVIGSAIGGVPEQVVHGKTGLLVPSALRYGSGRSPDCAADGPRTPTRPSARPGANVPRSINGWHASSRLTSHFSRKWSRTERPRRLFRTPRGATPGFTRSLRQGELLKMSNIFFLVEKITLVVPYHY